MTLCKSYTTGEGFCQYGVRCQFCHISTDFSDFDSQRTRFQNLLNENAAIMKSRIDLVANPDVSTFNIAMPSKGRLAIFEKICNENNKPTLRRGGKKNSQNNNNQKRQGKTTKNTNNVRKSDVYAKKNPVFRSESDISVKMCTALGF